MNFTKYHTFHIPVLGLAYSVDTPIKVARFGIDSVVSIIQDSLLERMREYHSRENKIEFHPVSTNDPDYRAHRITSYLNLLDTIVQNQILRLKNESFVYDNEINRYFMLLPDDSPLKQDYQLMLEAEGDRKLQMEESLKAQIVAGSIDVNIMAKVDNPKRGKEGLEFPLEFSDAMSALRGYAKSNLSSAIVFSAGLNPRLYGYLEEFGDFFPDSYGRIKKKVILKVSDYRSATIQGKLLAKKGIWVSEFRIESGLNCGGHAFATDGWTIGLVLEEFKQNKIKLSDELRDICNKALLVKKLPLLNDRVTIRLSYQGGIGTHEEDKFLRSFYNLDSTGWGSPFLLVPEATNVDQVTLNSLANAKPEDYYLSNASPLGIPFHNFRLSTSNSERLLRIQKNRPGSPCYKKHLAFNTEFSEIPICLASREYQKQKIEELKNRNLPLDLFKEEYNYITEKECLCEGLSTAAYLTNKTQLEHGLKAVAICPGPNLKYFSGIFNLNEMVNHIYGKCNLLNHVQRPSIFFNEIELYVTYIQNYWFSSSKDKSEKDKKYLNVFLTNLQKSINYYEEMYKNLNIIDLNAFPALREKLKSLFLKDFNGVSYGEELV